jgi:hypothetical protein
MAVARLQRLLGGLVHLMRRIDPAKSAKPDKREGMAAAQLPKQRQLRCLFSLLCQPTFTDGTFVMVVFSYGGK